MIIICFVHYTDNIFNEYKFFICCITYTLILIPVWVNMSFTMLGSCSDFYLLSITIPRQSSPSKNSSACSSGTLIAYSSPRLLKNFVAGPVVAVGPMNGTPFHVHSRLVISLRMYSYHRRSAPGSCRRPAGPPDVHIGATVDSGEQANPGRPVPSSP